MSAADVLPAPALEPAEPADTLPGAPARRRNVFERVSIAAWRLIALGIFLLVWHLVSIPAGHRRWMSFPRSSRWCDPASC
jgi:hypothetical protein